MAGRPKQGLDYAAWSTDIFDNDTKIDKLLDAQGWYGFDIYFYLCMKAMGSNGYYYKWCYDDCASTARKMGGGIGAGTVKEAVDCCFQIGLFSRVLFEEWGVLTSRGIQRSYLLALKARRSRRVYKELWLLEEGECEGLVLVPINSDMPGTNAHLQEANDDMQEANAYKEENESKTSNKNTMCKADALALFERLWKLYPCKKGKGQVSDRQKLRLLETGYDEMARAVERYKAELEKDSSWRKPQNGSTFFNSGYVDYLDANYVPDRRSGKGQPPGRGNSFNQFPQNSYDFEQLEKDLLSN